MTTAEIIEEQIEERRFYWLPFLRSARKEIARNSRLTPGDRRALLRQTDASLARFENELIELEREKAGISVGMH